MSRIHHLRGSMLCCTLLAFAILFSGCNVFEGFYEAGSSDDPEVLIEDADFALQQGDTEKAVTYLRKAAEKQPENKRVRTKLAVTLLDASGIDILTLEGLAEALIGEEIGGAAAGKVSQDVCRSGGIPAGHTTEEIDYQDTPEFREFEQHRATLQEIKVNTSIALSGLTINGRAVAPGSNLYAGASTPADSAAVRAELFDAITAALLASTTRDDYTEAHARREAAALLMVATVSEFSNALVDLEAANDANGIRWFRVTRPDGSEFLDICAPTQANVDAAADAVACVLPDLQFSSVLLLTRAENLNENLSPGADDASLAEEVSDHLDHGVDMFNEEFASASCSAG